MADLSAHLAGGILPRFAAGASEAIQLVHRNHRERAWPCTRYVNSDGRPSVNGLDLINHIDRRQGVPQGSRTSGLALESRQLADRTRDGRHVVVGVTLADEPGFDLLAQC